MYKLLSLVVTFLMLSTSLKAAQLPFYNYARYKSLSEKLLTTHNLNPADFTVLQRNSVYYLRNYLGTGELSRILRLPKEEMLELIFQRNFWADKLERDLSIPYTDFEFAQYMNALQEEVNAFLRYVNLANSSRATYKLYLYGSFAKGRFGGNSSLDFYVESDNPTFLRMLEEGIYSKDHPEFKGNISLMTSNFGARYLLDPLKEVDRDDLSDLKQVYQDILVGTGFALESKGGVHIKEDGKFQRYPMEFNAIEDRVYFLVHRAMEFVREREAFQRVSKSLSRAESNKNKSRFMREASKLKGNFDEVAEDLQLIANQVQNSRHDRIKEVISAPSYQRLASYRSRRLLRTIDDWLSRL